MTTAVGCSGLSERSRRYRFFSPVRELSPDQLERVMRSRPPSELALVAEAADGAWMHRFPPSPLEALAGLVTFSWRGPTWLEEDEPLQAHARDPHKRVDVVAIAAGLAATAVGSLLAIEVVLLMLLARPMTSFLFVLGSIEASSS